MFLPFDWSQTLVVIALALISLAFQVFLVALGVVVAWRWLHRPGGYATIARERQKNAFEILEERYARGEIDTQEFEERWERIRERYRAMS